MKGRISATIGDKTEKILELLIKEERYRNRSHAIEEIIIKYWEAKHAKKK